MIKKKTYEIRNIIYSHMQECPKEVLDNILENPPKISAPAPNQPQRMTKFKKVLIGVCIVLLAALITTPYILLTIDDKIHYADGSTEHNIKNIEDVSQFYRYNLNIENYTFINGIINTSNQTNAVNYVKLYYRGINGENLILHLKSTTNGFDILNLIPYFKNLDNEIQIYNRPVMYQIKNNVIYSRFNVDYYSLYLEIHNSPNTVEYMQAVTKQLLNLYVDYIPPTPPTDSDPIVWNIHNIELQEIINYYPYSTDIENYKLLNADLYVIKRTQEAAYIALYYSDLEGYDSLEINIPINDFNIDKNVNEYDKLLSYRTIDNIKVYFRLQNPGYEYYLTAKFESEYKYYFKLFYYFDEFDKLEWITKQLIKQKAVNTF